MNNNPVKIVKNVLIVLGIFAASILYIFVSSAAQGRNYKGKTPDMYGTDSLEYVGEPVMKISVWQKNEKNPDDYPEKNARSSFFYNVLSLDLKKGTTIQTVENIVDNFFMTMSYLMLNIVVRSVVHAVLDGMVQ